MKNLIKKTLSDRFNLDNFTLFAKNLFNEIDISPYEIPVTNPDGNIKKFTFLGGFSDTQKRNIDVLAVELTGDTKVERARAFQRNLVARYLKDNIKDAGLVAFYSKDNPDWRLSFVKIDYKITEKGVKLDIGTPPKRYSFLVGQTEPSHTAQKQLLPILEDHNNNPLISEIEDAFSVEKVTKEFYEKYRKLFENLSKDLKKNKSFQIIADKENIDIDNFAKKLLGQIVFLYFLQKKGWLGVPQDKKWGEGDKFFLRTLFDKAKKEKKNFYDNYLEILFYDTLNNPRRDEVDPAYSRYFDSKIPFLNGGLFEPDYDWKNTIVYLEDDIFEDIIDTFDLYNFTVKEDEPLEKEVAVDPEMLGKVFENLLPENLRKGQGAYYTPREIVHYMCQESLINHLSTETKVDIEKIRKLITLKDNAISGIEEKPGEKVLTLWENEEDLLDNALSDIKVCDPACGSGAFLVGMLNEIVSARHILGPKKSEYLLKKETIQNSIYGVDIDPGAVEIAKLRLWLSLVVDYELRDIEPLPNLDYKIMCGNSLLEELIVGDESIKLFDEKLLNMPKDNKPETLFIGGEVIEGKSRKAKNEYLENLLKEKQKELIELHSKNQLTSEKKKALEQEISAINKELNPKLKKSKGDTYHSDLFGEKAEKHFNKLKSLHKEYFTEYDPVRKKEKRKQIENIELEFIKSSIKEKVDEIDGRIKNLNMQNPDDRKKQTTLLKKKLDYMAIPGQIHESKTRPYFLWKLNFFEVFQEKGGFDVVIANPPYISATGLNVRQKIAFKNIFNTAKGRIDTYGLFTEKAIILLAEGGCISYIVPNKFLTNLQFKLLRQLILDTCFIIDLAYPKETVFEAAAVNNVIFILQKRKGLNVNKIRILEIDQNVKLEKCKIDQTIFSNDSNCTFLLTFSEKSFNIENKIKNKSVELSVICDVRDGIIAGRIKDKLFVDKPINKYCRRLIFGNNMDRYKLLWGGKFVDYRPTVMKNEERKEVGSDKGLGLRLRIPSIFETPKIITRKTADKIIATYDSDGYYFEQTLHGIISKSDFPKLQYILGCLNSKLYEYYYKNVIHQSDTIFPQVRIGYLKQLPIHTIESNNILELELHDKIVSNVNRILDLKNNSKKITDEAKVKECERQIDQMVYKLYSLTEEEIELVESK